MDYELVIIGAGPAGVSAAVYAARKQLKTAIVSEDFGGQSVVSETIYNWIGSPEIAGHDLAKSFEEHVRYYEGEYLDIKLGSLAEKVEEIENGFKITLTNGDIMTTETLLISTGSGRRKLSVPGADKFEHKGLTYCATCDGPVFAGQDVVVVGGGNAGFESASQLAQYCKSVTILHRSPEYRAEAVTVEKILARDNVTGILNAETLEVTGENFVNGIRYKDKTTGEEHALDVTGIFVEIGQIPNTGLVADLVELDDYKRIVIDPYRQRTSKDRLWAAGDCCAVMYHQNNIAAGDGVKALEDIYNYLHA